MEDNLMAAKDLTINEIASDPEIHNGRPIILGTTVKVSEVTLLRTTGEKLSPAQIAERCHLNLAQAYAALAYYYLHQAEMDEEIRRDAEEANKK
jgi:uncharacterized protein (DUF433 family)